MRKAPAIKYIDRKSGEICTETVMGSGALNFAYNTLLGKSFWGILFKTGFFSALMGKFYDSRMSHSRIKDLVAIPGLNAAEAEKSWQEYRSFNDFFTRRLKADARSFSTDDKIVSSPADGRMLVYPDIDADQQVPVKGALRSLRDLCVLDMDGAKYSAAVIRLAPIDYHRYHYPCDCTDTGKSIKVRGKYHSVNPIAFAKAPDLFVENTRCITMLDSPDAGKFFYIEIGAFGVGSIVSTSNTGSHKKMDEKGFFKFGGSTVIVLFDSSVFEFDRDLIGNSENGMETLIRCGEQIGRFI